MIWWMEEFVDVGVTLDDLLDGGLGRWKTWCKDELGAWMNLVDGGLGGRWNLVD